MTLKTYQNEAVNELLNISIKLLNTNNQKKLIFKAPTGSEKTIVMAEFLKQLIESVYQDQFCVIWAAPRKLHEQSFTKLTRYFEPTRTFDCVYFDELIDKKIFPHQILFLNWESFNKKDNLYIKENEQDFNLSTILENTKIANNKIILVIDESHYSADAPAANKLRDEIKADLTIEVSATPVFEEYDGSIPIQIEAVKKEGMIKKAVILNENFENRIANGKIITSLKQGSEETIIHEALEKRKLLKDAFNKEKTNINPLILIQLPDRKTGFEDELKQKIINILKKNGITIDNYKLAIWLSEEKTNKELIEKQDNETEVLIFKQAIALGWDCPRAQIIVLFREWHSPIFSIQTVGRIMRMPEPDKGHYENDVLNYGYIYTNLSDINLHDDISKGYISIFTSRRNKNFLPINLHSFHFKRQREKTRLTPLFNSVFLQTTKQNNLSKEIDITKQQKTQSIISDWKTENINLHGAGLIRQTAVQMYAQSFDLQRSFEFFIRQNCSPFYPEERTVGRIKEAIYAYFLKAHKIDYEKEQDQIIQIIFHPENKIHFSGVLREALLQYQTQVLTTEKELIEDDKWNPPDKLQYNKIFQEMTAKRSLFMPFYYDGKWKTEKAFIEYLENNSKVIWWFKNGEGEAANFGIPYFENGVKVFYPDFIIQTKKGIGIFDTKSNITLKIAQEKIVALQKYIAMENKKGKSLFGGVVFNTDQREYKGVWKIKNSDGTDMSMEL